jgi:hypothetical protein
MYIFYADNKGILKTKEIPEDIKNKADNFKFERGKKPLSDSDYMRYKNIFPEECLYYNTISWKDEKERPHKLKAPSWDYTHSELEESYRLAWIRQEMGVL